VTDIPRVVVVVCVWGGGVSVSSCRGEVVGSTRVLAVALLGVLALHWCKLGDGLQRVGMQGPCMYTCTRSEGCTAVWAVQLHRHWPTNRVFTRLLSPDSRLVVVQCRQRVAVLHGPCTVGVRVPVARGKDNWQGTP
jgi:hypothetical protein